MKSYPVRHREKHKLSRIGHNYLTKTILDEPALSQFKTGFVDKMYFVPPSTKVLRQRRSRSTASDRFPRQSVDNNSSTMPNPSQKPDIRLMSLPHPDRSRSYEVRGPGLGQPPRDELYRVSRRRIVGSVLGHEQEELERVRQKERLMEQVS